MTVAESDYGGQYTEAFVGQPRYINPLLSHSSSADRGLTRLIFSGLFEYDNQGILKTDVAERFEVDDELKEYVVFLRQDVRWHDGEQVTADDIILTTNIARDIAYGAAGVSNDMRLIWNDIRVEKIDDFTVKFVLTDSDSTFLNNLTLGLLPEHIWGNITPEQFQLAEYNQKPIGSGPYEFVDLDIDVKDNLISAYILRSNKEYYRGEPFITKFIANFYPTRSDAVSAYYNGEVSGIIVDKREHIESLSSIAQKKSIELPHYFAVFFNQIESVPLAFDEVREALSRATDRDKIIAEVFVENASVRYSPFADGIVGFDGGVQQAGFDKDGANALLDEKGWERGEDKIRSKDDDRLAFTLHIGANHTQIARIAEMLKEQWREIGVEVTVQEHDKGGLEANIIKPRDYDALLYAHQMRFEPNLLPLWSGKEKNDPGINYALFDDEKMNESLDNFIKTKSTDDQLVLYKTQQERLKDEIPAVFLFAPKLSFMYNESVKGISANKVNASYDRYVDIQSWYIKEKRVKK